MVLVMGLLVRLAAHLSAFGVPGHHSADAGQEA